jgi:hypothetical protein
LKRLKEGDTSASSIFRELDRADAVQAYCREDKTREDGVEKERVFTH